MVTPAEAEALIRQHLVCLPVESLPLPQCMGAVLRENVYAERDQPPFDRVAMDGIAIDSTAWKAGRRKFRMSRHAGRRRSAIASLLAADDCMEVMTGAVLPQGCDTVIPIEQLELLGGSSPKCARTAKSAAGRTSTNALPTAGRAICCSRSGALLRAPEDCSRGVGRDVACAREQSADDARDFDGQRAGRAR